MDNCIWIFNPIATSCPYSNWGDMLNYFPGEDYVQMIGLTSYQMNNDDSFATFREMYTELYKKNTPYFDNYPAIIGEFGCGAGGDVITFVRNIENLDYPEAVRFLAQRAGMTVPENGEDLGLYPVDTEEEAREDLAYIMASFSTFRWLDED